MKIQLAVIDFTNYIVDFAKKNLINFTTRKEYAEIVRKSLCPDYFFLQYDNKVKNFNDYLWSKNNKNMWELLNKLEGSEKHDKIYYDDWITGLW